MGFCLHLLFCLGFILGSYDYRSKSERIATISTQILNIAVAYMMVFVIDFCSEVACLKPKPFFLIKLGYIHSIIFSLIGFSGWLCSATPDPFFNYRILPGPAYHYFSVYVISTFFYSEYLLIKGLKTATGQKKNQIAYVIFALSCGYPGGIMSFFPVYGIPFQPFALHFVWLYAVIISYAIMKHQLLDIQIVIKKTFYYALLVFSISLIYVPVIMIVNYFIFSEMHSDPLFFSGVITAVLIVVLFKLIEMVFHRVLDRKFFKGTVVELSSQKERLQAELERRERLKSVGILAAGMAHEIKNPITALKTFAEYLPSKGDQPEFREKLARVLHSEIDRIEGIVRDLLLFSKPAEPQPAKCDINAVLLDIQALLSARLLQNNIHVESSLEEMVYSYSDLEQTKQAFLNLIMNAIEAMAGREKALLILTSRGVGKNIEVIISDTGCGIEDGRIKSLFDPFSTSKVGGTGLGLAVTQSIIEKNNGSIKVESQIGIGTRFTLILPAFN